MKRSHPFRTLVVVFALALAPASCRSDDDAETADTTTTEAVTTTEDVTTTLPPTVEQPPDDESAIEAFCQKNDEVVAVRGAVYGPPFTETPEEIEAMLVEAVVLQEELDLLVPDEIRESHALQMAEFVGPIDALTEELGWDPYAAINTAEAAAIFADPAINAATEELMAFLVVHCGLELPPEG